MAASRHTRDNLSPPGGKLRGASPNDRSSFSDISSNDGIVYTPTDSNSNLAPQDGVRSPLAGTHSSADFIHLDGYTDMDTFSTGGSDRHMNSPAPTGVAAHDAIPVNRQTLGGPWSAQRPFGSMSSWPGQPPRIAIGSNNTFQQDVESNSSGSAPYLGSSQHMIPGGGPSRMQAQNPQLQTDQAFVQADSFRTDAVGLGSVFDFNHFSIEPWTSESPRYPFTAGSDMALFGPASSDDLPSFFGPPNPVNNSNPFTSPGNLSLIPSDSVPSSAGSPLSAGAIPMPDVMSRQQSLASSVAQDYQQQSALLPTQHQLQQLTCRPDGLDWNPSLPTEDTFPDVTLQPTHHHPATSMHARSVEESSQAAPPQQEVSSSKASRRKRGPAKPAAGVTSKSSIIIEQYEGSHGQAKDRSGSSKQHINNKRAGGRILGSHLTTDKAAKTKKMRADKACWLCSLQRDMCSPGDTCDRCFKRRHRPQADHSLGCVRTKLPELRDQFLPRLLTSIHEDSNLRNFCSQHISKWYSRSIKLTLECGKRLPWIRCEVYEFQPRTNESLRTFVGAMNVENRKQTFLQRNSPPLGMQMVEKQDRQQYGQYINDIVDHHFDTLASLYFAEETQMGFDFPSKLLKMMYHLKRQEPDEVKLMREVFRLVVVTYIMGRALKIPDQIRDSELCQMSYYDWRHYGEKTCPRMANKQLKYLFSSLHVEIMTEVLKRLQQYLRSSRGNEKWTSAFCAILGLAMVHEDTQRTIHLVMDSEVAQSKRHRHEGTLLAEQACRAIDEQFMFITALFQAKYNRQFNPLNPKASDVRRKVAETLGVEAMNFADTVGQLVKDNCKEFCQSCRNGLNCSAHSPFTAMYLDERRNVNISASDQERYPARLIARFLLSFWNPS